MDCLIRKIIDKLNAGLDRKDIKHVYFGNPYEMPEALLLDGVVMVVPVASNVRSITTGIGDEYTNTINVIVAKTIKNKFYKNAEEESGAAFITRVVQGTENCGQLKSNTVLYILRNNLREFGVLQPQIGISYDTNSVDNLGAVSAVVTLTQVTHVDQPIN